MNSVLEPQVQGEPEELGVARGERVMIGRATRTKYVNSETQNEDWYARAPFPAVHTEVHNFILVSNNGTPNYLLHMSMHTTVTAGGVPTAFVDNYRMGCQG